MSDDKPLPRWSWSNLKYYLIPFVDQPLYNEKPVPGVPGWKDTKGKHFPDDVRIPDWRKYKVSGSEELSAVEVRLRQIGLKNPWLRNEVWRYDRRMWQQPLDRNLIIFRTMKYGVAIFIVTEALKYTVFKDEVGHDHHHEDPYKLLFEQQGKH